MKSKEELSYVKRTQRDYSLSFKLQVVSEVESEELSIKGALRKYGIQFHATVLNWIRKMAPLIVNIKPKRQYRITTNSHHRFRKHKNLIEQLDINKPEQVWVSDITYVGSRSKPLYLSLVTDAYSKKIMGYDLSDSLAVRGSLRALKKAIKERKHRENSLIHHSDRGLQYCSNEYQALLKRNHITPSMTESYDPYANAVAERINGILKDEFMLEKYNLDRQAMQHYIKDCIKKYNRIRPHYSCHMLTPKQMHSQSLTKMRTYKKLSVSLKASLQTYG